MAQPPPAEDDAAIARAALEKQRVAEEAKLAQERQQMIDQITNSLAVEKAKVFKFRDDCEAILDENSNKIAKVSFLKRRTLRSQNSEIRESLTNLIQVQLRFFEKTTSELPDFSNPNFNPQVYLAKLQIISDRMENDRHLIVGDLSSLETSISNAPAKKGLFFTN